MTGLRVRNLSCSALLILLPARAHAACDVPPDLLACRPPPEPRWIVEGERRYVAKPRLARS
jgi:hypothetical protein